LPFPLSVLFLRSVAALSNLDRRHGSWPADHDRPVHFRPAQQRELEAAVRLIVCQSGEAQEGQFREFVRLAQAHSRDAGGTWVAEQEGRLISAVMPIASPGRTMLLFLPMEVRDSFHEGVLQELLEHVCAEAAREGIHLVQVLLDGARAPLGPILERSAFARLAELLYLQTTVTRDLRPVNLPRGWSWQSYSPANHAQFGQTILASYQRSLDCPKLNGLRDIEDILAGHRATGEFDPRLWFLLCEHEQNMGVLLLSAVRQADMIELVYLGVPPEHRGRGVGDLLVRHALATISTSRFSRLSLAVDAGNLPALKVYWRHGLQAVGRKVAMMRDLRQAVAP